MGSGQLGTLPGEGLKPTTLQKPAGLRREPPMSLRSAIGTIPYASHRSPAAAPAAGPGRVVGVEGLAEYPVEGLRAGAELGGVRLADGDRPGLSQPFDDQRVVVGDEVPVDGRAEGSADALGRKEVLVRHRQAMQRTELLLTRKGRVGCVGAIHRLLRREGNDGVDPRVDTLDLGQVRLHHLQGGELLRANETYQLGGRQEAYLRRTHNAKP